ncbi:ATP-binding protein [Catenuloplanes sp. NPDC051500]|uniref:ATP-binding response regulator n=1 Tax=Catenuloplanes sp. NPDC051500 TaxID=3363959 RepID=UPI003799D2BF
MRVLVVEDDETLAEIIAEGLREHDLVVDVAGDGAEALERAARIAPDADPVLLGLLIRNLLENAVRHNVPGGSVWLSTRTEAGTAVLEVANTGPIVPADIIPTLRQAFQRGVGRTRGVEGSGLGLAIVDAVVDAHDGEWTATPRPGGGLTVTLRLPARH